MGIKKKSIGFGFCRSCSISVKCDELLHFLQDFQVFSVMYIYPTRLSSVFPLEMYRRQVLCCLAASFTSHRTTQLCPLWFIFFPIQDLEDTRASPVFPESELLMRRLYGSTLFWKEQDICGCISFLMLL